MRNRISIILFLISITIASDSEKQNLSLSLYSYDEENASYKNYTETDNLLKPMALSMLVPGLGQYLQGSKKKAWFFFGVELLSITANKYYNNKADEDVLEYKDFANQNWSFENWIKNYECWNPSTNGTCDYDYSYLFSTTYTFDNGGEAEQYIYIWENSHHIDFYYDGSLVSTNHVNDVSNCEAGEICFPNLYQEFKNWDSGEYFIDENNNQQWDSGEDWDDEDSDGVYDGGSCNGQGFVDCHNIEVVMDHHFYEGIRKYNMFFAGWDDSVTDIVPAFQNNTNIATSPKKQKYNQTWNNSIQLYDYAQYALTAIYLNHVISIFDVYLKSKFDNRFNVEVQNNYDSSARSPNYLFKLSMEL